MNRVILALLLTAITIALIVSLVVWLCSPAANKAKVDCLSELESMTEQERHTFDRGQDGDCAALQEFFVLVARFEDRYTALLQLDCQEDEKKVARLFALTAKEKQARTMIFALNHDCCWALEAMVTTFRQELTDRDVPDREAALQHFRARFEVNCTDWQDKQPVPIPKNDKPISI